MPNRYFQAILDDKIEKFRFAFEQSAKNIYYDDQLKKLIHPGEFGMYREFACKEFLRCVIPYRLDIGSGFLINGQGDISTQCDLVIYDRNNTPLIENDNNQRFYPVETVSAIGEVKSDLSLADFKLAINKLARNKVIREHISHPAQINGHGPVNFRPQLNKHDHVFSFLICNRFKFDIRQIEQNVDSLYESDIKPYQKHNLILSINDGLLYYYETKKVYNSANFSWHYPFNSNTTNKNRFTFPGENRNAHFNFFCSYLFMGTSSTNLFYPEMSNYITAVGGFNRDQLF